ncbi:unnamed protein product, partial [Medioppia subpectinata]
IETSEELSILSIASVQRSDSANYSCFVSNTFGRDSQTVVLSVKVPPTWLKEPQDIRVKAGDDVVVECLADGLPKPTVKWISSKGKVTTGEVLNLANFRTASSETYECIADNGIGDSLRKTINVFFSEPLRLSQKSPLKQPDEPVVQGKLFKLTCSVESGTLPVNWTWFRNGQQLSNLYKDYRFDVRIVDNYARSSTLNAYYISDESEANYTCVATNASGSDSQSIMLKVEILSNWINEPNNTVAKLGDSASIECSADGSPQPVIQWCRRVSSETCYRVMVPAKFDEKYSLMQVKRGESARLKCNVSGDQPLAIKWTKDNVKLEKLGSHSYEIFETTTDFGLLSELLLRTTQRTDGSIYKCEAENTHGKDERTIKLVVLEVPGPPMNVHVKEVWSRTASIVWSAPYSGNSPLTKYTIQYWRHQSAPHRLHEFVVSNSQTTALIKDLSPGLSYEMTVVGENEVGRGEAADTVTFVTGEEEPSAHLDHLNSRGRDPFCMEQSMRNLSPSDRL